MSNHNVFYRLNMGTDFPTGATAQAKMMNRGGQLGYMWAYGNTVPTDGATGYSKGCIFQKYDGTLGTLLYINIGSVTSANFDAIDDVLFADNISIATGKTLDTVDADGVRSGGVIVPQNITIPIYLQAHASLATRVLFYASDAWTVTGLTYEPLVAEATGSVVCTVCKVTGNNVAVAATTPMCVAFAVTGTAGTPVVADITTGITAADKVLAATNKIGCIFSGGDALMDTGMGMLYVRMKRS